MCKDLQRRLHYLGTDALAFCAGPVNNSWRSGAKAVSKSCSNKVFDVGQKGQCGRVADALYKTFKKNSGKLFTEVVPEVAGQNIVQIGHFGLEDALDIIHIFSIGEKFLLQTGERGAGIDIIESAGRSAYAVEQGKENLLNWASEKVRQPRPA